MDRRLRNRILLYLLVAGVLAFGLIELSGRKPAAKISAVMPTRENLASSITSNGKVEPIEPYVMRAQLDTFVEKVHAKEGQQVKKGQVLLELNVKDASAQLSEAQSKLLRAQEDLRAAKGGGRTDSAAQVAGDLAKAQAEVTRLAAAKQEFDRGVRLDAERAALQVQQAQHEVAALQDKVRNGWITAPVDGTLYSQPAKAGDFVKLGDLLAEMADLRKVRVRVFIDEPELGALEPNQPVKITWDALPNQNWAGKTEIIPKQVVARGSRSVGELLCSVNNDKLELLPNTNVNVRINSKERLGVLAVPRGAVEAQGGRRYVFVVKKNQLGVGKSILEKREIHVGIADATSYEVVSGLQEGEMVALPGDVDLRDGMYVIVVNTEVANFRGNSNG